jgi:hypothetical protein
MTKRKADAEVECPVLIKTLRRSITEFITQNEVSDIHGDKNNLELLDYGGEIWQKYRQRLATYDVICKKNQFCSKALNVSGKIPTIEA